MSSLKWFAWSVVLLVVAAYAPNVVGEDPAPKAPEAVVTAFERLDRNKDKKLSIEEFQASVGAAQAAVAVRDFDLFDRDADDFLSLEEFWSLPTRAPELRGPLPDPLNAVVDQFVAILDQQFDEWDKSPERTVPLNEFLMGFSKTLEEPVTGQMQREADPDLNRKVSRAEARRFVEIQAGVRRSDGKPIREANGRVYHHIQWLIADIDRDERVTLDEFLLRGYSGDKAAEIFKTNDLDNDGFLTWDEWIRFRIHDPIWLFRQIDANLDGQLDSAELLVGTPDWIKVSAKIAFPAFDTDRNGTLSLDEYRLTMHSNMVASWGSPVTDPDGDGVLTRSEFLFERRVPVLRYVYFGLLDTNGDGVLDAKEFPFKTKMRRAFYSMNADGSDWTRMFDVAGFPQIGSPSISPDGKWLAFDGHGPKEDLSSQMMIMTDLTGETVRNLGPGMMPNWSKDGRQMCYSHRGLWLMNSEGKEPRQFSNGYSNGWGAQWSPDGKRIVYFAGLNIMMLDVASEKSTAIYNISEGGYRQTWENMKWSPDSKRICFKGLKPIATEEIATLIVDPEKAAPNQPRLKVHHSGKSISTHCAWHPNGNRIVFGMHCPERNVIQLYEFNPNTDDPVQLVKGQDPKTPNACAVWTPDGKRLLVIVGDY